MTETLGVVGTRERTARGNEERVRQLHEWEAPHVAEVHDVRGDAQQRQGKRQSVDGPGQGLHDHDEVDDPEEEPLRQDGVLLDDLGEIVEARR